ncbi:MAG: T9SS type A sorting domain-containing protein [Bacteroidota bacterium]
MKQFYSLYRCALLLFILNLGVTNIKAQPFNGFMNFDGIDDEFLGTGYPIPSNSDFTIEFWFKVCEDTIYYPQVFLGNSDNLEIDAFTNTVFNGPNTYQLCVKYVPNNHVCHQDQQFYFDAQWHHIAVTYVKALDRFNIFYDGIDGTIANSINYSFSPFPSITLGVATYQPSFKAHYKGYMDEMRISNTVRYPTTFTPPTAAFTTDANTVRLWHFDEANPVTSVTDHSGNGFNLTPSGSPRTIQPNNLILQSGIALTTDGTFNSYQWINCSTGVPIAGATTQTYTPTANGSYAVIISNSSCSLTTSCYEMTTVGLQTQQEREISVYPNPANDVLYFNNSKHQDLHIQLFDQQGKVIDSKITNELLSSFDISGLSAGIYFLKIYTNEQVITQKIIKQ